jgi:hypothetical protein
MSYPHFSKKPPEDELPLRPRWWRTNNHGMSTQQQWAKAQAEALADDGVVSLTCNNNWWKLYCHVGGVAFSTSSTSIRKCVHTLAAFVTRGCQYVEVEAGPQLPVSEKQRGLFGDE